MTGKRIAALIGGVIILLAIVGNAMGGNPEVVQGLLISLTGAFVGLMAGFVLRGKTGRRSFWIPLCSAIGGAIAAQWIAVLLGIQFPGADPAEAMARVTGRGLGEGFVYGGAIFLIIYGLKGPYKEEAATSP